MLRHRTDGGEVLTVRCCGIERTEALQPRVHGVVAERHGASMEASGADGLVNHGAIMGCHALLQPSHEHAASSATVSRGIAVPSLKRREGATQARGQQRDEALGGVCPPVDPAEAVGDRRAAEISWRHDTYTTGLASSSGSRG